MKAEKDYGYIRLLAVVLIEAGGLAALWAGVR